MVDAMTNPPWSGRRAREALRIVKRRGQAHRTPCAICNQAIDYTLEYPDPQSCSVQHVKAQSLYPHLRWDPGNWAPAHLECNVSLGTADSLGLGVIGGDY